MASGLNFANCLWYEIEQGLLQDRLDWSKDRGSRVSSVFLGRVRIPPITVPLQP